MKKNNGATIFTKNLVILLIFSIVFLSSCENSSKNKIQLKIINFRVEDQKYYTELNQAFMLKYPKVEIMYDAVPTSSYLSLVSARMTTNDVDVFGVMTGMELDEQYSGNMIDLSGQDCLKGIDEEFIKYASFKGVKVSAPLNIIGILTFYNKQIFMDNNLQEPKTWTEFVNVCDKLKGKGITPIIFGGKDQWPINVVMDAVEPPIVRGNNPDFYSQIRTGKASFDDPSWKEAWQKLAKITTYFQENSAGLGYNRVQGLFAQKTAAMLIDGTWSLAQIQEAKPDFEIGAFILPTSEDTDKNKKLPYKIGGGIAANKKSTNKDYALKYINFHLDDKNYQKYVDMTLLGSVKPSITSNLPIYKELYGNSQRTYLCENLISVGMPWNVVDYGNRVLLGKMKYEMAAERMSNDIKKNKTEWSKYLDVTH